MPALRKAAKVLHVVALLFFAIPVVAQSLDREDLNSQPYIYGSIGAFTSGAGGDVTYGAGGGADWLVFDGLSAGVDATVFGNNAFAFFVGSFNLSYHFIPSSGRLVPFIGAGIGFGGEGGSTVGIANLGGGVNLWMASGMAVRIEVRGRIPVEGGDTHIAAQIGLTF